MWNVPTGSWVTRDRNLWSKAQRYYASTATALPFVFYLDEPMHKRRFLAKQTLGRRTIIVYICEAIAPLAA